jgi:hypothetical protein
VRGRERYSEVLDFFGQVGDMTNQLGCAVGRILRPCLDPPPLLGESRHCLAYPGGQCRVAVDGQPEQGHAGLGGKISVSVCSMVNRRNVKKIFLGEFRNGFKVEEKIN